MPPVIEQEKQSHWDRSFTTQGQFSSAAAVCKGDDEVRDGLEKEERQDMKWLKAFDFVHNVKMKKFPDQNVVENELGQVSK